MDFSREGPPSTLIETSRLRLRPQRPEDAAVLHRLWSERDPRVPAHRRIDSGGHPTIGEIAERVSRLDSSRPGLLAVELRGTGEVIGYCGLVFDGAEPAQEPELAFELLREAQNNGFATEAGEAVIVWAAGLGFRRLWASVWDWNVASRRVLAKLHFHETDGGGAVTEHGRSLLLARDPYAEISLLT